jgi:hypothetical protein
VLDFWVSDEFEPVVSSDIIKEYSAVLIRDKFSVLGSIEERLSLMNMLLSLDQVILVNPQQKINAIKDDPKDNIFLECAVAGDCKLIVSGDQHLLQLQKYKNIEIITARDFIVRLQYN